MALFRLLASLGLDTSGFELGLKRSKSAASRFGDETNSLLKSKFAQLFGVAAIAAAVNRTVEYGSKIHDLSQRLGVSAKSLQEFDYAARQNGSTLETLTSVIERLGQAREKALGGDSGLVESFKTLGITIDELRTKRADELLKSIGKSLQGGDPQALIASLRDVGGRGGGALIPMLKGLEEAARQANELGLVLDTALIDRLDEAGDKVTELAARFRGPLASAISFTIDRINDLGDFMKIAIGVPAAWMGAGLFGRGANIAGATVIKEVMDAREARQRASSSQAPELPIASAGAGAGATSGASTAHVSRPQLTERQAIGAFIGIGPTVSEIRKSNNLLSKIEQNTRKDPVNDTGGLEPP